MLTQQVTQDVITDIKIAVEKIASKGEVLNAKIPTSYVNNFIEDVEDHVEFLNDSREFEDESEALQELYFDIARMANEEIDIGTPAWGHLGGYLYLQGCKYKFKKFRQKEFGEGNEFYELHKFMSEKGIDSSHDKLAPGEKPTSVFLNYTKEELEEASGWMDEEYEYTMTYLSAYSFTTIYSEVYGHKTNFITLPQERYLTIALFLTQNVDPSKRMAEAKQLFNHLRDRIISPATPVMNHANIKDHQLSSCFIDTVEDSLNSIYDSNTDLANVSKFGGGIGVYVGKIRSRASSIRGIEGVSKGIVPWIKQLNNTAVSVDQLGQRSGAIAVYLDIWHADLMQFLSLKLNNGDERQRAHDIFTALSIPDLFMETLEQRGDWHLFDPSEVERVMGFRLEDYYDEEDGQGSFREKYMECVANKDLKRITIPAVQISKAYYRSQLETGTPFMFFRDEVNRMNPNKHEGIIYASNLCTEIAQNTSETVREDKYYDELSGKIVTYHDPGDFVVCNLFSINLPKAVKSGKLKDAVKVAIRSLDNTIELNRLPVVQAEVTNKKYRSLGLGTLGWDHLRVLEGLEWNSQEAVDYTDELYSKIAYWAIEESSDLAAELGSYEYFEGSEWQTGKYFERRGYFEGDRKEDWEKLAEKVRTQGMRNAYLLAVAPNSTTSTVMGTTASIDPLFKREYSEEKADYNILTVAPDITAENMNLYGESSYHTDQFWSMRQNIARQRHIDQAISFNIYIPNNVKVTVLRDLHMMAWKGKMKTIYYTRSTSSKIEECEWCHA